MYTIRTDKEIDKMLGYLRRHKVNFSPKIKEVIRSELKTICIDFKMQEEKIKGSPGWMYD